jgi:hypothetical protein
VLIIDEAQEMNSLVLSELRLLASADLDSRSILTIILAGDHRLATRLEEPDLLPIATTTDRLRLCSAFVDTRSPVPWGVTWLYCHRGKHRKSPNRDGSAPSQSQVRKLGCCGEGASA